MTDKASWYEASARGCSTLSAVIASKKHQGKKISPLQSFLIQIFCSELKSCCRIRFEIRNQRGTQSFALNWVIFMRKEATCIVVDWG